MNNKSSLQLGRIQRLTIRRIDDDGAWLGNWEQLVLLPAEEVEPEYKPGLLRTVFVYKHPKEGIRCTTKLPDIEIDEIGFCEVRGVSPKGVTVDIGNGVRALIPAKQVQRTPAVGMMLPIFLFLDEKNGTLAASTDLEKHLLKTGFEGKPGDRVTVTILKESDLGYVALIQKRYCGMLYRNEVFKPIYKGEQLVAYIKKVREDGLLDLTLRAPGYQEVEVNVQRLLLLLKDNNGYLPIGDKSAPEEVYEYTEMSKKTFKQAAGSLYKQRIAQISDFEIRLV
jgi:predicted RNA-binding protein (virulence factor B family)